MLVPTPTDVVGITSDTHREEARETAPQGDDGNDVLKNSPAESTAPQLDTGRYLHHLDDYQLTDAQAEEFLGILWNIILACIDLKATLDLDAVLTASSPLEKTMPTPASSGELSSPRKQNRLTVGEDQPAERSRGGQ
jgi:hypothetical protein